MRKKKFIASLFGFSLLVLTGCGNVDKINQEVDSTVINSDVTISTGRIDQSSYQSIIENGKYRTSVTRGYTASRLNSNYNLNNFENGLINLSKDQFSVDDYYFQEGQMIPEDTLRKWLGRKSASNPSGLNPEDQNEPIILQQILEQDFINLETQKLSGVSIGLALNSVYYTQDGSVDIPQEQLESEGKRLANELLKNLREVKGLAAIPITINLFEQAPKENIAGGHYFARAISENGDTQITQWEPVNESYILLPVVGNTTNSATEDGLATKFNEFKTNIQNFFPNLSGITGIAYYKDNVLQNLSITIMTKYYGATEIISFTQYVGTSVENIFDLQTNVEVQINSIEGTQAFVEKKAGSSEVYAHVFN